MAIRYVSATSDPFQNRPMQSASGIGMGMSGVNQTKFSKIAEDLTARTARYLRSLYPSKTADSVSADTGVPANTVAKWLAGAAYPNGRATMALIDAYGPEFLISVITDPPAWLDRAARAEHQARLEAEHERIGRELAELQR